MRLNRAIAIGLLMPAAAIGVAACGDDDKGSGSSGGSSAGTELTIYSSLPLQGTSRGQSEAVINGEKLALDEVANKVGKYTIKYTSLDDSTAQNPGTADESKTAQNARQAVRDKSTIFYLGEFNSGGTKVSLPILNKAGIPQISPSNTAVGLTTDEAGADPGEPAKYYPAKTRTYARVVPKDVPGIERVRGWERNLLAAVEHLAVLRLAFDSEPADVFVERLRRLTLIEATEAARYLGPYRLANLERFFRQLLSAIEESGGDATAILRALRRSVAEARDAEEGRPKDGAEDQGVAT